MSAFPLPWQPDCVAGDLEPPVLLNETIGFGVRDMAFYGAYVICPTVAGMAVFKMHSGDSAEFMAEVALGIPLSLNLGGHFRPKFAGSLAYIPNWDDGLWVVDLANPEAPVVINQVATPGRLRTIAINGSYAYGTSTTPDTGIMTFDITDPRAPIVINSDSTPLTGVDIVLAFGHAYVAGFRVYTFSLADPSSPQLTYINTEPSRAQAIRAQDSLLFITDVVNDGGLGGIAAYSLANPDTPVFLGSEDVRHENDADLFVWQSRAYIAGIKGLHLVDVSDPTLPHLLTDYDPTSCIAEPCQEANGIAVRGEYAYLVVPATGIFAYRIKNRGDCNADNLTNASDVIWLVNYVFRSGAPPIPPEQGDVNCDVVWTSDDIISLVNYIFKGAAPPFCP
jgi:hypothetical protein